LTSYGVRIGFDGIAIAQDGRIEPRNGIFPEEIVGRASRVNVGTRARNKMSAGEKLGITAACEKFIADVLKPRFLPEIRPTEFNYPVAIYGQWHGNTYRFITRYRSDDLHAYESEFDEPFARLEYVSRDRFDLSYRRHTDEWLRMFRGVSLAEALDLIENTPHFHSCWTASGSRAALDGSQRSAPSRRSTTCRVRDAHQISRRRRELG
jgi:hypothetical protein